MKTLILLAAITLASCTTTKFVTNPLALPEQPTYIKIPAEQLQCLSDEAYTSIVRRDKQKSGHIETLENVIKASHE